MANSTLSSIDKIIRDEKLGFIPTSNATKPLFIANGLFRNCTGEICDTQDVHEWIVSDSRKDAASSEDIINKYQELLQRGVDENPNNIKNFRYLLDEIFDQDNTVYPSYGFSAMTITSHWMLKGKLNPEGGIGEFLFEILSKPIDGKRSPVIELIDKTLSKDNDDITKLIKPILAMPSDKVRRKKTNVLYPDDCDITWNDCKAAIRRGYDSLASNIIQRGEDKNPLLVLKRVVNFSVFATFFYLTQCNHAIFSGAKVPIVLDSGSDLASVKKASEQAYAAAKRSVEDYYTNSIMEILKKEISFDTDEMCSKWINGMIFESAENEEEIKPAIKSYYASFKAGGSPMYALAKALQIALYTFEYKSNSPSDFCRVLGVRCGLVGPKGNRAKIKRYLINSFTLETITLSVLTDEDLQFGIELKELSNRLVEAYNIILGSDADVEYELLEKCNISQSTPGDLRGDLGINSQIFANMYIALGLAKKYADGVTLIGGEL